MGLFQVERTAFERKRQAVLALRCILCPLISRKLDVPFHKPDRRIIPIFFINSALSVKIQLIHAEDNESVFGLPLFSIGIPVFHP